MPPTRGRECGLASDVSEQVGVAAGLTASALTSTARDVQAEDSRPVMAARGIIIAVALAVPFWTVCGIIAYLLS